MNTIVIPMFCPSCGEALEMTETELFCRNTEDCPAQNSRRILNFTSTMKIKGLGEKSIEKLFDMEYITTIPEIYSVSLEMLSEVLGDANAHKVYLEIQKSREQDLSVFIQSLGIKSIGSVAAKAIALEIKELKSFNEATIENSKTLLKELGTVKYNNLMQFFKTKLYEQVMQLDLQLRTTSNNEVSQVKGYVCITGKLKDFPNRKAAEEYLATLGWVAKASVTKEVTHLICEDSSKVNSTSYKKALEKGIPIVTITDLTSF